MSGILLQNKTRPKPDFFKNKNGCIVKTTTGITKPDFFPTFNADEFVLYFLFRTKMILN